MLFKKIKDFNNYWISMEGLVYNDKRDTFLKTRISKNGNGYFRIELSKNNKSYQKQLHRILAEAFIDNPKNYPIIDHINNDRLDNRLENLKWCNSQMNNHNKINNNEELNICKRNGNFVVIFSFKNLKIHRTFKNLEKSIIFRNIIQNKINNNEIIDKVFVELYDYEMKHIRLRKNGIFELRINKPNLKIDKTFKTLEEAKDKRNELLKTYYEKNNM